MIEHKTAESKRHDVFVSYAQADREVAHRVAETLQEAGLKVWFAQWELASGDSIAERIQQAVASSDILLVLLSPSSVHSRWVREELSFALTRELRDRAIIVIPTIVKDCEIPPNLANRILFDLRGDFSETMKYIIDRIGYAFDIDFSRLDGRTFEQMVRDLLLKLGLTIQENSSATQDMGFDFVATHLSRDIFGGAQTETWLVDAKFYLEQRVSVSILSNMMSRLIISDVNKKGLIITNSPLTSVARNFLAETNKKLGVELRVIDKIELTNLLVEHPDVIRSYFSHGNK